MDRTQPTAAVLAAVLLAGCGSAPAIKSPTERLRGIARALGDVWLRTEGTIRLRARAPHLLPLLDADADGAISLPEVLAVELEDAAALAAVDALVRQSG